MSPCVRFVDRCRTTNNMLGDCYGAAVVEHLSRAELDQDTGDKEAGVGECQITKILCCTLK